MADKQINELTEITSVDESDLLVVYDVDEAGTEKTKKILKSNFLNYEENSCVLTVADDSSGGNEGNSHTAYYTKVGNKVTISCTFINTDLTGLTGTNPLWLTGAPFACSSDVRAWGATRVTDVTFNGYIVVEITEGISAFRFINCKDDGGNATLLVNQFTDDTSDILFTITYFTS